MFTLTDQIVIVTAAEQGVGCGIAQVFSGAGAHVVIATCSQANGETTLQGLQKAGCPATLLPCDVSTIAVDAAVHQVGQRFGRSRRAASVVDQRDRHATRQCVREPLFEIWPPMSFGAADAELLLTTLQTP